VIHRMSDENRTAQPACSSDPDAMFVSGEPAQQHAKMICQGCGVRTKCLADALDNHIEFGVWGGMTERERRVFRNRHPRMPSWRAFLESTRDQDAIAANAALNRAAREGARLRPYVDAHIEFISRAGVNDRWTGGVNAMHAIANNLGIDLGNTVNFQGAQELLVQEGRLQITRLGGIRRLAAYQLLKPEDRAATLAAPVVRLYPHCGRNGRPKLRQPLELTNHKRYTTTSG
jgi:WhiB family transcriptional regulator, redox-sensing transcriptional regulator